MELRRLVLLLLLCSSAALKGDRAKARELAKERNQDWEDEWEPSQDKKEVKQKGDKDKKEDDKDKKKKSKKEKETKKSKKSKGKKCKPRKNSRRLRSLEETNEEGDVVCLDLKKIGECDDLRAGKYPEVPEAADGSRRGAIKVEFTAKSDDAIEKMSRALEEVALAAAGCNASVAERMLQVNNNTDATESAVGVNGVSVGSLSEISNDCTNSGIKENCTVVESPMDVYFSGDASEQYLNSVFYSLSDEVLAQAQNGDFDQFADIYYVEAGMQLSTSAKTINDNENGGTNVGGVVGGVIVGLALVGAAVGGFLFYRSRQVVKDLY